MAVPLQFTIFHGYPAELVAEWCAVSLRTARALKAGKRKPSPTVAKLFLLHRDRRVLGPEWRGWIVTPKSIVDPEGAETSRIQLHGYWLVMQYAREIAREQGPEALEHFKRLLA